MGPADDGDRVRRHTAVPLRPRGLFEAHLPVADLERSVAFHRDVVGLSLAYEAPERGAAFLWAGSPGTGMLGLWSLGSAPLGLALHVAFGAVLEDVLAAGHRLRSAGVTPLSFFATEADEPSVIAWMPAAAVYFRDPDGHLLELLAMLDEPPRPELGIVPWSEWVAAARAVGAGSTRVRVERHTGARGGLRRLFEMADDSSSQLDSYLDAGEVLVALDGDRVVGHLQLVHRAERRCEIRNMAVEPAYRGRGVGRALVDAARELGRERRYAALVVATAAADTGNLRFYQRAGFRFRAVERDVFTPEAGYPPSFRIDGMDARDRVWLDLELAADTRREQRPAS
jgi:lactoylglutathione lyase